MGVIINAARPQQRQGCYFTALMTKHRWEVGQIEVPATIFYSFETCSVLWPLLHPVNLSDTAISPRAAAIYRIFSLELTHDFIVPTLAAVQEELICLFGAGRPDLPVCTKLHHTSVSII